MLISIGEIIAETFKLYRKHFGFFLKYAVVIMIPSIIGGILAVAGGMSLGFVDDATSAPGVMIIIVLALILLASAIVSFWFSLSFIRSIAACFSGAVSDKMKMELKATTHLIVPGILLSILTALIILGGFILFIIPGIIFAVWYAFVLHAVAIDNERTTQALSMSKRLVQGRWWAVLWRLLIPGFVFIVIGLILQLLVSLPAPLMSETVGAVVIGVLSFIINLLITPLSTIAPTILYLELKKNPVEVKA